jgi:FAD/FMN-containing dehydrogenase
MSEAIDWAGAGDGLAGLRRSVGGAVLGPADAGFDAARRCFNTLVDRRPAVIVRCLDAGDVARAFDFARAHALEVAVRGGGHNPAGHCVCDGGLVIDLSLMRGVDVVGDTRTARADGGARWLDFDAATQRFGLVTPGGVVGSTGVAGLTLGGGIGHLTAQHGLTCDNLVGAELVTPDGTVVRAGPDDNPELLWGLRDAAFNISVMAAWLDPAYDEQSIEWARATAAALEPWSVSGGYMNYMQADEPIERVRAAFGDEAFERLQALKRRYDPDNVLRRNQNIPPL